MNKFIENERIYLRPIEESDIPTMLNWINDRDIIRSLIIQYFPVNEQWEREWVKNLYKSRENIILAIIVKENDTHIGNAVLHRIDFVNRNAEYGIMIGKKDYWGKGYCLEVTKLMLYYGFEILNLHRIYLRVFDFNGGAKNVI